MKKILCFVFTLALLSLNTLKAAAQNNYVHTTQTSEKYSASSPIGHFENYNGNGSFVPVISSYAPPVTTTMAVSAVPVFNGYNTVAQPVVAMSTYNTPVLNGGVSYGDSSYNNSYSVQDIKVPQDYDKTITTTESFVDTRETADKVIDRSFKIMGGLALVGAAAGVLLHILL